MSGFLVGLLSSLASQVLLSAVVKPTWNALRYINEPELRKLQETRPKRWFGSRVAVGPVVVAQSSVVAHPFVDFVVGLVLGLALSLLKRS